MIQPALYSSVQYSQSFESHLCKAESWEKIDQPRPFYQNPPCTNLRSGKRLRDKFRSEYLDLKERCLARYDICKGKGCQCSTIYHNHFFWSKGVVLSLIMNILFSTAMHGANAKLLRLIFGSDYELLHMVIIIYAALQILFPLAGYIADTHISRYAMIQFSLWSAWISFAALGLVISLDTYDGFHSINRYFVMPMIFIFLTVSYACFMTNVIPLGLDQLQGASHIHYNSFFYWWYWTFSLGRIIVTIPQYCSEKIEIGILIQAGISLLCITVALILDALLKHWLVIEPCCNKQGNPITQILRIARCIIKRPSCQHIPSTVRHEIDLSKCSRLDLAKQRYGGKYETEYVEDVRTFLSMLPVLVSIGFLVFSTSVIFGTIHLVQGHMEDDLPQISTYWQSCTFEISTLSAINAILLLALIPVLDLLMVPLLRHAMIHPSILKRLGVGGIFTLLGMLSLLTLEGLGDRSFSGGSNTCMFGKDTSQESNGMSGYWLILPMVLVTLAQIMIYIPSFEFISAQAPYNMRGLLIGIFLSLGTLFSLMSGLVQYLFSWKKIKAYPFHPFTGYSCTFWFFVITSSLTAIGVCLYMVIACKYKRRKRDDTFNQVGMIEEYFSSEGFHWD